jgi:hypothetical protein
MREHSYSRHTPATQIRSIQVDRQLGSLPRLPIVIPLSCVPTKEMKYALHSRNMFVDSHVHVPRC